MSLFLERVHRKDKVAVSYPAANNAASVVMPQSDRARGDAQRINLERDPWVALLLTICSVAAVTILLMEVAKSAQPSALHNAILLVVVFVCASLSSVIGFAFSAIAGAVLLHLEPDHLRVIQIMLLASVGLQSYCVAQLYRTIPWRQCVILVLGGAIGLLPGLYLLSTVRPDHYILAMGIGLTIYGIYMLLRRPAEARQPNRLVDFIVGGLGGITGSLAAFPGLAITIWCGMQGLDKTQQRAIYQPYILIMQILTLVAIGLLGRHEALRTYDPLVAIYLIPGIAGAYVGMRLFGKMTNSQFNHLVNVGLIASGIAMIFKG